MIGRVNVAGRGEGPAPGPTYSIEKWCKVVGLTYSDISDISEQNMRILMSKHASVDYFMEWYASDNAMLDIFTQNAFAMKWIGLNDYIADKLLAISDAESRLLASPYWEYILKDHVPIMTSNTTPYGEVAVSNFYTSFPAYQAFDGDDSTMWRGSSNTSYNQSVSGYIEYAFPNPICVKRIKYVVPTLGSAKPQTTDILFAGYNGTEEIPLTIASVDGDEYTLNNYVYVTKLRVTVTQKNLDTSARVMPSISTLQFYGRSLNVSVPTMTSNTSPYGEAIRSSVSSESVSGSYEAYKAFDKTDEFWHGGGGAPRWIGYDFGHDVCVKEFTLYDQLDRIRAFNLEGRKSDGTWEVAASYTYSGTVTKRYSVADFKHYSAWRINVTSATSSVCVRELQFFGVDYSDRTERTYLYDHGVELVALDNSGAFNAGTASDGGFTKNADSLSYTLPTTLYHDRAIGTDAMIDITPYTKLCMISESSEPYGKRVVDISNVNENAYVAIMVYKANSSTTNNYLALVRGKADMLGGGRYAAGGVVANPTQPHYIHEVWLER